MEQTSAVSRTKVEIMGRNYTLKGDVDPEYMVSLAGYVDDKLKELRDMAPDTDQTRLALLVALNIADEYFQAKKQNEFLPGPEEREAQSRIEEKTKYMISLLEKGLIGEPLH